MDATEAMPVQQQVRKLGVKYLKATRRPYDFSFRSGGLALGAGRRPTAVKPGEGSYGGRGL